MMSKNRLKILISAYACSPYKGSEPGMGWGFIIALSRHHDLWVITEEDEFKESIERYARENPEETTGIKFIYVKRYTNPRLQKIWPPSYYWTYRKWHLAAYKIATELSKEVSFDIVHQLNMVGFREPGYLWKLKAPFVWGPIGGTGYFPLPFLSALNWHGKLYYLAYNFFNFFHMHYLMRPKAASSRAMNGLIAATPEDQANTLKLWGVSSTLMTEVGLPFTKVCPIEKRQQHQPFRIVWAGLHIPRKALNLALEAAAKLPSDLKWELHILGNGPETVPCKRLAEKLDIFNKCVFYGWQPREKVLEIMESGHVFLLTSLRDLTATVTVEALANGMPIICLDHCGFSGVIDSTCGIKITPLTPKQATIEISQAIFKLAIDEETRYSLAIGSLKKAKEYSWEDKADKLGLIYAQKITSKENAK